MGVRKLLNYLPSNFEEKAPVIRLEEKRRFPAMLTRYWSMWAAWDGKYTAARKAAITHARICRALFRIIPGVLMT